MMPRAADHGMREWATPVLVRLYIPVAVLILAMRVLTWPINDPDTYWHLRTGEWLRNSWQFVGPDPFTDTAARDWILHEWTLELVFSLAHDVGGMAGVVWLHVGLIGVVMITVYAVCRQHASVAVSGFVLLCTTIAMLSSLTPRPHLATYAFMAITVHGWLRAVESTRPRWWLVVLPWVWASTHGMWFLGAIVSAMIVVAGALDRSWPPRRLLSVAAAWVLSVAAAMLGPAGWHVLKSPFQVSEVTRFITEWSPPDPRDLPYAMFLGIAGMVVVIWARSARRVPWRYVVILAAAVGLATLGVRFVAVSAAILAPVAAMALQEVVGYVRERVGRLEVVALAVAGAVGLGVSGAVAAGMSQTSTGGPNALLPDINALQEGTTVCNEQELGGWLLWHVPHVKPIIDGRLELFAVPFVERQVAWQVRGEEGAELPADLGCGAVLVSSDSLVPGHLDSPGWSQVGEGDGYVLFVETDTAVELTG